jgi:hypothetical protein
MHSKDKKSSVGFYLSKEADDFVKDVIKNYPGNLNNAVNFSLLGIALSFNDETHQSYKEPLNVHKGRAAEYPNINALALIYAHHFPDRDSNDVYIDLQIAASAGIIKIKNKYFEDNLINWKKLYLENL